VIVPQTRARSMDTIKVTVIFTSITTATISIIIHVRIGEMSGIDFIRISHNVISSQNQPL